MEYVDGMNIESFSKLIPNIPEFVYNEIFR